MMCCISLIPFFTQQKISGQICKFLLIDQNHSFHIQD